jgi:hypothetical protein
MNMSWDDYTAQWGCDPVYDRPPRLRGDGYLFYNFSVEGYDKEFLVKFIPAVTRTIKAVRADPTKYDTDELKNLKALKTECRRRLNAVAQTSRKG